MRGRLFFHSPTRRLTTVIWWLFGVDLSYHRGGDILFPYCMSCGERNRIELDDHTFTFTPQLHTPGCWQPRQQLAELRYIQRYGKRAARRRGLTLASVA